jgi:hypothetical protein
MLAFSPKFIFYERMMRPMPAFRKIPPSRRKRTRIRDTTPRESETGLLACLGGLP